MTATVLASGVVSAVVSNALWECAKLAHQAVVAALGHGGKHRRTGHH